MFQGEAQSFAIVDVGVSGETGTAAIAKKVPAEMKKRHPVRNLGGESAGGIFPAVTLSTPREIRETVMPSRVINKSVVLIEIMTEIIHNLVMSPISGLIKSGGNCML